MALYKITVNRTRPESSVSVYEDKDTPKAAYERGVALATNIFGSFDASAMFVKIEQVQPAA